MNAVKIAALVLIVGGVLWLLYGGFSYIKEIHEVKLGPIELSVKEKQPVNVPVWAGVGSMEGLGSQVEEISTRRISYECDQNSWTAG